MSFADKLLYCVDCQKTFTFSVSEQEFHTSRGFPNEPVRCRPCRQAKTKVHSQNRDVSEENTSFRKTFVVVCSQCGKATRVPFQPRQSEPVYCEVCYVKKPSR